MTEDRITNMNVTGVDGGDPSKAQMVQALNAQGTVIKQIQEWIVSQQVQQQTPPPAKLFLQKPQRYDGTPETCQGFLTQCDLFFVMQPEQFPSEEAKVAFMISLLCGKALVWATALWEAKSPRCGRAAEFSKALRQVFNHPVSGREAARRISTLRQGVRPVAEYAIEFRTLAAESKWDNEALMTTFYNGLSEAVKDDLASREWGATLDDLITTSICLDQRIRERRRERRQASPTQPQAYSPPTASFPAAQPPQAEAMEIGRHRVSPAERERRRRERCCLYCGNPGHFRDQCPQLSGNENAH